eukprot:1396623-Ditylum_brightwellii.AAC.1
MRESKHSAQNYESIVAAMNDLVLRALQSQAMFWPAMLYTENESILSNNQKTHENKDAHYKDDVQ